MYNADLYRHESWEYLYQVKASPVKRISRKQNEQLEQLWTYVTTAFLSYILKILNIGHLKHHSSIDDENWKLHCAKESGIFFDSLNRYVFSVLRDESNNESAVHQNVTTSLDMNDTPPLHIHDFLHNLEMHKNQNRYRVIKPMNSYIKYERANKYSLFERSKLSKYLRL